MMAQVQSIIIGLMLYLLLAVQAEAAEDKTKSCKDKITAVGRPNRIQSLSSMSAVIQWTQRANELGKQYGQWHNALRTDLSCKLMQRSGYYVCYASAKPCQLSLEQRAKNETQEGGRN
ncbi:hypothetical protein MnTg02_01622 [bacterium MnTg02]|nr:hypothetical protein MnTg02_01622 [bacterium MnTg02]